MKKLSALAPAKINLSLDILGKLPNGYHSVKMVMQEIPLCDEISVEITDGNSIEIVCDKQGVPTDSSNSAFKAAKLFLEKTELSAGVRITINKKIPAAAGMAGGSTDAAAVFKLLNEMFAYPLNESEILDLCLKIGADVPFCYLGGCALSEGIGEILTPITPLKNAILVIAKPQFEVSTKWVYQNFKIENVKIHPDTDSVIKAIADSDLGTLSRSSANVLETVTETEHPIISDYKRLLKENGAIMAMMSGSGPTVFGIFDNQSLADSAYSVLKELTPDSFLLKI